MGTYTEYPNKYPGRYTVHIDFNASSDKEACAIAQQIVNMVGSEPYSTSVHFVTDADDWAEHVHPDLHPDAVRVGIGTRICIDEHGNRIP